MADESPTTAADKLESQSTVQVSTQVTLESAEKKAPQASAVQPLPPPPLVAEKEEAPSSEPAVVELESVYVVDKEAPTPPPESESTDKNGAAVTVTEKEKSLATEATEPDSQVEVLATNVEGIEPDKGKTDEPKKVPESLVSLISFKEESNKVSDLSVSDRKALEELKQLIQEALRDHKFFNTIPPPPATNQAEHSSKITSLPDEIAIWGVPLLKDDKTDVILLKFLRARDFKVKDAFVMLKNTMQWRKDFNIDALINENLGDDLEKVVFMHGFDKDGHPVCYNVYGEFQNKELYKRSFADEEKRTQFLRWRIQFLEKSIRKFDFSSGGVCTIFQISDLKNSPGPGKKELRIATRQALQLLQDNYPEFVAKQVFINVPWWYLAFYTMISPFFTQRTKSKIVFASPSKTAETIFKYIRPEQAPIQYGGLSVDYCDCNPEFTINDPATVITVKPATKQTVEILVHERCVLIWELRVVGWEVSYGAEFVPNDEGAYTVILQKTRKLAPTDEPVVYNSFRISELGKILLTIDNPTLKKKKLVYRFKVNLF